MVVRTGAVAVQTAAVAVRTAAVVAQTVAAVAGNKRYVRLPKRSFYYHWLNNAPRRIAEVGLAGVKMSRPSKAR